MLVFLKLTEASDDVNIEPMRVNAAHIVSYSAVLDGSRILLATESGSYLFVRESVTEIDQMLNQVMAKMPNAVVLVTDKPTSPTVWAKLGE